ncbi:DUF507 family protein [Pseudobdellovibrio exovorus]|uniref:DUF507 domain-containing protein n=1 Tax=Pseudobdellovibrio exovorus JSS TaxID=1184267 RepID=M4V616_9BACT|nr:DUF507 family protein [Pseudobdellovibrio exovorus]AGH94807.1 hypothetical protein A11Q_587 [Pseudobdellovibrio exovorus JSS]
MILSEDRQYHLAHIVTDKVWGDDIVDFSDDDLALKAAKIAIIAFVKEDMEIDKKAREKVASLKRNVVEGTREWEILYKKYYEEERNRYGV